MRLDAQTIAAATGGRVDRDAPAGPICTDTRKLAGGEWFLALRGDRFDGHDYLAKASAAGVAGVIAEATPPDLPCGVVIVPDTLAALQDCARHARSQFTGPVVGVTGSAGKTTTRAMIAAALGSLGAVHQTAGNLNNHIGLPLTLLDLPPEVDLLVLEMGMSAPREIALLQDIGAPNHRMITNVYAAHLEGTGSIEGVARCKQEMFDGARPGDVLYINQDDPRVRAMPTPPGVEIVRYGSSNGCDIELISAEVHGGSLETTARIRTPAGELTARLGSPGEHLAFNAAAAAAVAWRLGIPPEAIARGLADYRPVGMRMRVERLDSGITVLNDAYNANPASALAAIETLARADGDRRIALLGDMLELGDGEAHAHETVVRAAATAGLDLVGLAGSRMAPLADLARSLGARAVLSADDSRALGARLRGILRPGDVVLLKGSRGARMERILQELSAEGS